MTEGNEHGRTGKQWKCHRCIVQLLYPRSGTTASREADCRWASFDHRYLFMVFLARMDYAHLLRLLSCQVQWTSLLTLAWLRLRKIRVDSSSLRAIFVAAKACPKLRSSPCSPTPVWGVGALAIHQRTGRIFIRRLSRILNPDAQLSIRLFSLLNKPAH